MSEISVDTLLGLSPSELRELMETDPSTFRRSVSRATSVARKRQQRLIAERETKGITKMSTPEVTLNIAGGLQPLKGKTNEQVLRQLWLVKSFISDPQSTVKVYRKFISDISKQVHSETSTERVLRLYDTIKRRFGDLYTSRVYRYGELINLVQEEVVRGESSDEDIIDSAMAKLEEWYEQEQYTRTKNIYRRRGNTTRRTK